MSDPGAKGTPGTFRPQRLTDRNGPSLEVGELTSGEVSAERQETSVRSGFRAVSGQIGFELSPLAQDSFIELATGEVFGTDAALNGGTTTGSAEYHNDGTENPHFSSVVINAADDGRVGVISVGGSVFCVGRLVRVNGTNDRIEVLVRIDSAVEPTDGATSLVLVATFGERARVAKHASMLYSTIEKVFPEASQSGGGVGIHQRFEDMSVNNFSLSIQPGNLVTGTADLVGLAAEPFADGVGSSTSDNLGKNETAYSPFASCVGIGGKPVGVVSGLDFTINNNRETVPLLCSPNATDVFEGVANVTGTVTLLFEDAVEYNKFQDEAETQLTVALKDAAGESSKMMVIDFPRVRYSQPSFEIPANGPVVLTLNFRALQQTVASKPLTAIFSYFA